MATPIPAMPPPHGETSNFNHPDSLLSWDVIVISLCLSVTTILFLLRVYVRVFRKREWVSEDRESCGFDACVS